jgi:hypothetical protein
MTRRRRGFVSGTVALLLAALSLVAVEMVRASTASLRGAARAAERTQDLYLLRGMLAEQAFAALANPVRARPLRAPDGRSARLQVEQESSKADVHSAEPAQLRAALAGVSGGPALARALAAQQQERSLPKTQPGLAAWLEGFSAGPCALSRLTTLARAAADEQEAPPVRTPWPEGEAFTFQLWLDGGRGVAGLAQTYLRDADRLRIVHERVLKSGDSPCR